MGSFGFFGAGLAQGLGQGILQGEQLKRQKALQEAYMKHLGFQDEMLKSQEAHARFQEASAPLEKINNPITAPALAPAFAEAHAYARNPAGYTKTFPGTPSAPNYVMQAPGQDQPLPMTPRPDLPLGQGRMGYGPQAPEPPMSPQGAPETLTGATAFGRTLQGPMEEAGRLYQANLDKLFGQKKELANAGVARQQAMAIFRDALARNRGDANALLHAKLGLTTAVAKGQVLVPEGMDAEDFVNQIALGAGGDSGSPTIQPPGQPPRKIAPGQIQPGIKPMGANDAKSVQAMQEGLSYLRGLKQNLATGDVKTGLGMAIRTSPFANKISSITSQLGMPLSTENEQKMATALGEHLLVVARSMFPGRVSNYDIQYLDRILGRPAYSNRDNVAKIDALIAWAEEKQRLVESGLEERGIRPPAPVSGQGPSFLGGSPSASGGAVGGMPPGGVRIPQIAPPGR